MAHTTEAECEGFPAAALAWPSRPTGAAERAEALLGLDAEPAPPLAARCGWTEEHMDYEGQDIAHFANVSDAGACCTKCQENPRCRVWMWGTPRGEGHFTDGGDRVCTLRHVDSSQRSLVKKQAWGVVSGLPFDWVKPSSLFCFALVMPHGYERDLLNLQLREGWGIFGCDEYQVLSNQSLVLGRGISTSAIDSDLKCEKGGEFGTALNNDIFSLVWRKVIDDGRYKYNAWTVKADADCVFFPQRLRVAVAFHPDTWQGIYLNNCKFGLHGPLEILSWRAVERFGEGAQRCRTHFSEVCSGDCLWGEDMFLDQCLDKVLKVHRSNDWNLLSEPHCDAEDWQQCGDHKVAYHPFKSAKAWADCMSKAGNGELPMVA